MKADKINLQRLTYFFILLLLAGYLLVIGKSILAPLAFGMLLALMVMPVARFFDRWVKWQIPSITLTIFATAIPVLLVITLFSTQLVDVVKNMPSIEDELMAGLKSLENQIRQTFGLTRREAGELLSNQASKLISMPLNFLQGGLTSSTSFVTGSLLAVVYLFLFLLYRSAFKNFILMQSSEDSQERAGEMLHKIQTVVQQYFYGLMIVMLILGTLNSLGLWIIGLKHALFWGFLAAFLAIIPYIGTFLGGLLPFLYALATPGYALQPLMVVALFAFVQFIEGNFITPNVVGSSVKINPLAAIVALLVGNAIWGIAGMVLALPAIAILKEVMKQVDFLRPVGLLMSDELTDKEDVFINKLNKERFRFWNFFKQK